MSAQGDSVKFRAFDYRTDQYIELEMTKVEFVEAYARHILPARLRRFRFAGLFRPTGRTARLSHCRKLLGFRETEPAAPLPRHQDDTPTVHVIPAEAPEKAPEETTLELKHGLFCSKCAQRMTRWPKPFIALRASRRTELERSGSFANHVLNEWFGHSAEVADTYYLQVTEEDFTAAIRPKDLLSGGVSRSEEKHKDLFEDLSEGNQEPPSEISPVRNSGKTQVLMGLGGMSGFAKYTQQDSNLQPSAS